MNEANEQSQAPTRSMITCTPSASAACIRDRLTGVGDVGDGRVSIARQGKASQGCNFPNQFGGVLELGGQIYTTFVFVQSRIKTPC